MERRRDAGTQTGDEQVIWSIWGDLERVITSNKTSTALICLAYCLHQWAVYEQLWSLGVFFFVVSMSVPSILGGYERLSDIRCILEELRTIYILLPLVRTQLYLELFIATLCLGAEITFSVLLPLTSVGFFGPLSFTKDWKRDSQYNGDEAWETWFMDRYEMLLVKASVLKFLAFVLTYGHVVYSGKALIRIPACLMFTSFTAVGKAIGTLNVLYLYQIVGTFFVSTLIILGLLHFIFYLMGIKRKNLFICWSIFQLAVTLNSFICCLYVFWS